MNISRATELVELLCFCRSPLLESPLLNRMSNSIQETTLNKLPKSAYSLNLLFTNYLIVIILTESLTFVDWERRYTQQYEDYIYQQVQAASIQQVSREENLSWDQVQGIFKHKFAQQKTDWGTVRRVGIDEVSQRKGHKDFVPVVCDIDQSNLLEVIDRYKQADIIEVPLQQPLELRQQVEEVSIDMWEGFPKVVASVFLNAQIVFDRFHVMRPVNQD